MYSMLITRSQAIMYSSASYCAGLKLRVSGLTCVEGGE